MSEPSGAELLLGRTLDGGWSVTARDVRPDEATGGFFSVGYTVESKAGHAGYLKALDFSKLLSGGGTEALEAGVTAFNFEVALLERCERKRMNRIVRALGSGMVRVPESQYPDVYYLIFEKADTDASRFMLVMDRLETAWILRTLHSMSVALWQLHRQGIAHQDLKPSNVLLFGNRETKLGDLGRSTARDTKAPHDNFGIKGAKSYAPPELIYRAIPQDWEERHLACDLYLLGSLAVSFLLGVNMTAGVVQKMSENHHPQRWSGSYSELLPYLREAFGHVLDELGPRLPRDIRDEFIETIRRLCDPDPSNRGHPRDRAGTGSSFSLQRFVSRFDVLATRAEYGLR